MGEQPPSPGHLVLVGMMGTGKTTVGRGLAARLGRPFVDSDDQVEARTGRTVREIFETDGEATYRRIESDALAEALGGEEPAVIAAAGGVVIDPVNRRRLGDAGTVVWLRADPALLATRVGAGGHRPLLDGDPLATLTRLAAERDGWYREVADEVVDVGAGGSAAVVERILALVGARVHR